MDGFRDGIKTFLVALALLFLSLTGATVAGWALCELVRGSGGW